MHLKDIQPRGGYIAGLHDKCNLGYTIFSCVTSVGILVDHTTHLPILFIIISVHFCMSPEV